MTGQTIAHYEILGKLGTGVVYEAGDTNLDRFVAIKVRPPATAASPERKRRFVQEAKSAAAPNHPGIRAAQSLQVAYAKDVVHGDIESANLIVT